MATGLVIGGQLLVLVFAVGGDCGGDDDDENNGEDYGDDAEEMEGAVEGAGTVVGVDCAAGLLGEERQGGRRVR